MSALDLLCILAGAIVLPLAFIPFLVASVDPGSVFDDRVLMTIGCQIVLQAGGWEASR
jgi:hypothetical protein